MLAKRTRFQVTLLKELAAIQKMPDEVLDRTALRHVFRRSMDTKPSNNHDVQHESVVIDVGQLNAEQRRATASILTNDITLVTGPPGTGKSQVVSSTTMNARLKNRTVLFGSRNHKAMVEA